MTTQADFEDMLRRTFGPERAEAQMIFADFMEERGHDGAADTLREYAREPSYMTCIHCNAGLCSPCYVDYIGDPQSWIEMGHHPEGEANWKALQEEMAADNRKSLEGRRPNAVGSAA